MQQLIGVETEYALTAFDARGKSVARARMSARLVDAARKRYASLPDGSPRGLFLENGSRFYLDCNKPEIATPECPDPAQAVRYVRAGERMLEILAVDVASSEPDVRELIVWRTNVDPVTRNAWGTHESILYRTATQELPVHLIPHLVSRIVYTGAGGFNCNEPAAATFTLSPRVWCLVHEISPGSTGGRGIFHCKEEPLASAGYHRLHIICGETVCSDLAAWLKLGATALVVAMIDAGLRPGFGVQLRQPLEAMRQFALDPTCRVAAPSINDVALTALAIQRHYLALAERHVDASFMPPWARTVCIQWRAILERLESGSDAVATQLDWAIKLTLFRQRAARVGIRWDALPRLNHVARVLAEAMQREGRPDGALPGNFRALSSGPIADAVHALSPHLRAHRLDWRDFDRFVQLRQELFEIDARFGQLGERGIFSTLARNGVLHHQVDGVGAIDAAIEQPPPGGRASLRGRTVRELSRRSRRYRCDWTAVWDRQEHRVLDLSDPFATAAEWRTITEADEDPVVGLAPAQRARALYDLAMSLYHQSRCHDSTIYFARAAQIAQIAGDLGLTLESNFWRATVLHGCGQLRQAAAVLDPLMEAPAQHTGALYKIWTRRALISIETPAPLAEIRAAIDAVERRLSAAGRAGWRARGLLVESRLALTRGQYAEARTLATEGLDEAREDPNQFSNTTYWRTIAAAGLELGELDQVTACVDAWEAVATEYVSTKKQILACARSEIARRRQQPADAIRWAEEAVRVTEAPDDIRAHVASTTALLRALACAGERPRADALVPAVLEFQQCQEGDFRYGGHLLLGDYYLACAEAAAGLPIIEPESGVELAPRGRRDRRQALRDLQACGKAYWLAMWEGRRLDELLQCDQRRKRVAARYAHLRQTRERIAGRL